MTSLVCAYRLEYDAAMTGWLPAGVYIAKD
jgi:hypothetical protein